MPASYVTSEAAQRVGIAVPQLRTYVSAGLVKLCAATSGGYFLFDEACITRLRLIGAATRAGLRIREIEGLVHALEVKNRHELFEARRSVTVAIGTRVAAIQQLEGVVSNACGTGAADGLH